MAVSVNEFENIKREALYGEEKSTAPSAAKFSTTNETKKILEDFDREKRLSKKALGTRYIYWKCIRNFFFYLAKQRGMKIIDLEKLTKDEIADFLDNCGHADSTVNTHKIAIKILYKHMTGGEGYPPIVKWIKVSRPEIKLPKNLIEEEHIKKLVEHMDLERDQALVMTLYESAGRISEVLNTNLDDLTWEFDPDSKIPMVKLRLVDIKGHSGERFVALFDSAPYLQRWINKHPFKDNPESPLFISLGNASYGKRLNRQAVAIKIKTVAKRIGLQNVTLNPHSFRHRRLTESGKYMSEFEVKYLAGHKMSSRMANVYIHTNDQDVANKERIRRGLKPLETSGKIKKHHLAILKCAECGNVNPATFQFCFSCGDPIGDTELSRQKKFLKIIEKAEDDHRIKRILNLLEDIMTKPHPV